MGKAKVSPEQKLQAARAVVEKRNTLRQVAYQYHLHHSSVEKWVTLYQTFGEKAFERLDNNYYPKELKKKAVEKYLTTEASQQDICREFQLRSISQLQQWVKSIRA